MQTALICLWQRCHLCYIKTIADCATLLWLCSCYTKTDVDFVDLPLVLLMLSHKDTHMWLNLQLQYLSHKDAINTKCSFLQCSVYWDYCLVACCLQDVLLFTGRAVIYRTCCYLQDVLLFTGPAVIYSTCCRLQDLLLFTGRAVDVLSFTGRVVIYRT